MEPVLIPTVLSEDSSSLEHGGRLSEFSIEVGSDQEHEDLIAEILYKGQVVAVISQEKGPGVMDVETLATASGGPWRFPLIDFQQAIEIARARLLQLQKDRSPQKEQ